MSQADQLAEAASALNAAASQYASISNTVVGISTAMAYIVGDLQQTWKGNASQSFMGAWNRAVRDAAHTSEALANASTAMNKLASAITSNLQPFENLSHVEIHETDPKVIAKAEQAAETATSEIQSAASAADGELQNLLSMVGTCSTGTEPLPPGWSVTLKGPGLNPKALQKAGNRLPTIQIEGGRQVGFNWDGTPPPNIPFLENPGGCSSDPFNWKDLAWTMLITGGLGSLNSPLLNGPRNKRAMINAEANGGTSALVGAGWSVAYNKMKKRWQWVCNASKKKPADKTIALLPGIVTALGGKYIVNHYLPATPPKSSPHNGGKSW